MSKVFDFNAISKHTLETKLNDIEGTVLHVTTPPENLIEQLAASQEELTNLWKAEGNTVEKSHKAYELAAKLMSCNEEGVTITADDLRGKYRVYPMALVQYIGVYMEFINEFHNAKN